MKIAGIYLASVAFADEKKVPPRHPLQRLNRLVEFSHEFIDSGWFLYQSGNWKTNPGKHNPDNKYTGNWNRMWKNKFETNAERMERNFKRGNQRCGFYDENLLPHGGPKTDRERRDDDFAIERYDKVNVCVGMKQILTGFSKWSTRYLSACSGQKNHQHQVKRMERWEEYFYEGKV